MTTNISDRLEKRLAESRSPARVLVVEDSREDSETILRSLRQSACETFLSETAEKALEMVEVEVPDLVILDLKLPGMSGMQLLRIFYDRDPPLPVVIMTDPRYLSMLEGHLRPTDYVCIYMKPITPHAIRRILIQHNLIQGEREDRLEEVLRGPSSPSGPSRP